MTDTLLIADRAYSSWSLRGWLLYEAFGLPVQVRTTGLYAPGFAADLARFAPARSVPAVRTAAGHVLWDSLAIAETLAETRPGAGHWPADPGLRALARSMAAEMHSSFRALRQACPMNLRAAYAAVPQPDGVAADLTRIEELWDHALGRSGGPWLCGAYSAADAFFAPVAARIAGHCLPVGPAAAGLVAAHLAHPAFRRWRAMAQVDGPDQTVYDRPRARRAWPGPAPLPAHAVGAGPALNAACPCCGDPPAHFLAFAGQTWGLCTPFCRDMTAADPEAWPAFMALAGSAGYGRPGHPHGQGGQG
ncbi:MAG: glutathione S-transferase [Rhodobacteraceae bacterium]|jgi:glutathione S-transferase|nr:glutathione S-transferase [Paracoccaceae bacterium]